MKLPMTQIVPITITAKACLSMRYQIARCDIIKFAMQHNQLGKHFWKYSLDWGSIRMQHSSNREDDVATTTTHHQKAQKGVQDSSQQHQHPDTTTRNTRTVTRINSQFRISESTQSPIVDNRMTFTAQPSLYSSRLA